MLGRKNGSKKRNQTVKQEIVATWTAVLAYGFPSKMPTASKAIQYSPDELDLSALSDKAFEVLHVDAQQSPQVPGFHHSDACEASTTWD